MKKILAIIILTLCVAFIVAPCAEAKEMNAQQYKAAQMQLPPNAQKVVTYKGNYYALYKGKYAAFEAPKYHARTVVIPKYIKFKNKRYKVVCIHEFGLLERVDIKKVIIKATEMEIIEEPALYKKLRKFYHKKLKVIATDKNVRQWLNEDW